MRNVTKHTLRERSVAAFARCYKVSDERRLSGKRAGQATTWRTTAVFDAFLAGSSALVASASEP